MATGMEATNTSAVATDSKVTGIRANTTDPEELNHSMDMGRLTTAINQVEQGMDNNCQLIGQITDMVRKRGGVVPIAINSCIET